VRRNPFANECPTQTSGPAELAGLDIGVQAAENPAVQRGFPDMSDPADNRMLTLRFGWRSLCQLLRFKDWCFQNGLFLLGTVYSGFLSYKNWPLFAAGLVVSSLCLAHGYALNHYFDGPQISLRPDARLARSLLLFTYFLLALALGLSCLVSLATLAVVALIGVTSWLHSSPPFSLKKHIFWRLFLNSFGFSLVFLAGASLDNRLSVGELLLGVLIFGLYVPLELIHVLAHMDVDRASGVPTFPLARGEAQTIVWAIIILIALILFAGLLWQLKCVSLAFAGWSGLHLSLLALSLLAFYKRENTISTYAKLRLRAKIVCAVYGLGMLVIFAGRI
jgi:4-hydroxybenzoate polyprenyltransferase